MHPTNMTSKDRPPSTKAADLYDAAVEAVFFNTPVEICIQRNAERYRIVPEDAIREMARKLRRPAFDEGFCRIIVIEPARPRRA